MKESDLIKNIQLAVTKLGHRLFRVNSGMGWTSSSKPIRTSFEPMKVVLYPGDVLLRGARPLHGMPTGTSDLIGWTRRKVTIDDVGKTFAIFTVTECKTGKLKPTEEQSNYIDQVRKSGGYAGVAYSVEDALEIIEGDKNGNKD